MPKNCLLVKNKTPFNSFPNDKILHLTKLKALVDNNLKVSYKAEVVPDGASSQRSLKSRNCLLKVYYDFQPVQIAANSSARDYCRFKCRKRLWFDSFFFSFLIFFLWESSQCLGMSFGHDSFLSHCSKVVLWENSKWLGQNIIRGTGKKKLQESMDR